MEGMGYPEIGRLLQYVGASWLLGFAAMAALGDPAFRRAVPVRPTLAVGVASLLIGAAISVAAQTAMMTGTNLNELNWDGLSLVLLETQWGWGASARLALGLMILAHLLFVPAGRVMLALTVLVMASFAFTGHGAATEGAIGLVHVIADVLHLVAAGIWIGMLFVFLALAVTAQEETLRPFHKWLEGFSGVGSVLVSVLIVTGIINTYFLVGLKNPALLLNSPWFLGLIIKLVLFALMLGCAAANRFYLTPRFGRGLDTGETSVAVKKLRNSLWIELGVGFGVLLIIAAIGMMAPPAAG